MKRQYQTLDDYLDDLDAIKEKVAERTRGMTTQQVIDYFAGSAERLYDRTGQRLRARRPKRKRVTAKR